MISTLLGYRLYSSNLPKSLERVEPDGRVARDAKYYQDTIGTIGSVDDFLGDDRLYSYALKAYGLEDHAAAKGFIRKVLESDLADRKSLANSLADARYRDFASAFNFKAAGAGPAPSAQSGYQTDNLLGTYSEHRVRSAVSAAAKTTYYEKTIVSITSAEDFVGDDILFEVAMKSIGVEPASMSRDFVRRALTGEVQDDAGTLSDDKFFVLAAQFNFEGDGAVTPGTTAQAAAAASQMIYDYNRKTDNVSSPQAAAHNSTYFRDARAGIDDADDLVNDPRLFEFVLIAAGLDPSIETPGFIRNILVSDPDDPASTLSSLDGGSSAALARKQLLTKLNGWFEFQGNGSIPPGGAQTPEAGEAVIDNYYDNYQKATKAKDDSLTNTFRTLLPKMKSIGDLLARHPVFGQDALKFVLKAFDLDLATESLTKIRKVLQSDASDPASYVSKLGDERYEKLAAAFNFDGSGKIRPERLVQTVAKQTEIGRLYAATYGTATSEARRELIRGETKTYLETVGGLRSLDGLIGNKTVVAYALRAFDLEKEGLSDSALRNILTSDLGDKDSYVHSLKDERYRAFADAFNFTKDGLIQTEEPGVQGRAERLSTENLYLLRTLEERAGEENEGTRLALYFLRKSADVTSTLQLLADRALMEVARTALGLPASLSQLDLDKQVAIIEKRLDIKDFADPKKLDKFISRFAALYDLNNESTALSPVLALFGNNNSGRSAGGILASL